MKAFIIAILIAISVSLSLENLRLKNQPLQPHCNHYYKSDLSRVEMMHALFNSVNDSIAVLLPADTTVLPYLIKSNR